jgi:hypothetical protein
VLGRTDALLAGVAVVFGGPVELMGLAEARAVDPVERVAAGPESLLGGDGAAPRRGGYHVAALPDAHGHVADAQGDLAGRDGAAKGLLQGPDVVVGEAQRLDLGELGVLGEGRQGHAQPLQGVVQGVHPVALPIVRLDASVAFYAQNLQEGRRGSARFYSSSLLLSVRTTRRDLAGSYSARDNNSRCRALFYDFLSASPLHATSHNCLSNKLRLYSPSSNFTSQSNEILCHRAVYISSSSSSSSSFFMFVCLFSLGPFFLTAFQRINTRFFQLDFCSRLFRLLLPFHSFVVIVIVVVITVVVVREYCIFPPPPPPPFRAHSFLLVFQTICVSFLPRSLKVTFAQLLVAAYSLMFTLSHEFMNFNKLF